MGIFKKLFKRKKKEEKKQAECWYNNAHEQPQDKWVEPVEGGPCSPNSGLYADAQSLAKNQNR